MFVLRSGSRCDWLTIAYRITRITFTGCFLVRQVQQRGALGERYRRALRVSLCERKVNPRGEPVPPLHRVQLREQLQVLGLVLRKRSTLLRRGERALLREVLL